MPTITEQLEQGVRNFELDVWRGRPAGTHDAVTGVFDVETPPVDGDLYVSHFPDVSLLFQNDTHVPHGDDRSTCETLKDCLTEIKDFSSANRMHEPIVVFLELKDASEYVGFVPALPSLLNALVPPTATVAAAIDKIENELPVPDVQAVENAVTLAWGTTDADKEMVLFPSDVKGDHDSMKGAMEDSTNPWPLVGDALGKVMFVVWSDFTVGKTSPPVLGQYALAGYPRDSSWLFMRGSPNNPSDYAAVLGDAPFDTDEQKETIKELTKTKHYMVRVFTGEHDDENPISDVDKAVKSRATIISTDYPGFTISDVVGSGVTNCRRGSRPCVYNVMEERFNAFFWL